MDFRDRLLSHRIDRWSKHYIDWDSLAKALDDAHPSSTPLLSKSTSLNKLKSEPPTTPNTILTDPLPPPSSNPLPQLSPDSQSTYLRSRFGMGTSVEMKPLLVEPTVTPFLDPDIPTSHPFLTLFHSELTRVNTFFTHMLQSLEPRLRFYQSHLSRLSHDVEIDDMNEATPELRSAETLKIEGVDLYRELMSLQSYAVLNYSGFIKLLKRHDKVSGHHVTQRYNEILNHMEFARQLRLKEMISELEHSFGEAFCNGNATMAHAMLIEKRIDKTDWKMFGLGMRFGGTMLLLFWALWDCIVDTRLHPSQQSLWVDATLPIYRGLGCIVLMRWLWGLNLYVWVKARINYIYLFELDPRHITSYADVFEDATSLSIVYLLNFLMYFKMLRGDFPAWFPSGYLPVGLFAYMGYRLVPWPFPWRSNVPNLWWRGIGQVIIAPFGQVSFLTNYVGDVMTSMVRPAVDLAYTCCYLLSWEWMARDNSTFERQDSCLQSPIFRAVLVPLISALPLWFRFLQCLKRYWQTRQRFPHIANAGKYAVSHSVVLFGVFHSTFSNPHEMSPYKMMWIMSLVVSTFYTFSWDVLMDWGLGDCRYGILRERLMFSSRIWYYLSIAIDLVMRFTWTLTLIPQDANSLFAGKLMLYLSPFLAAGELCRRSMWGCFRLEIEHLHNTQNYHRVDFIPLHFELPHDNHAKTPERSGWAIVIEVVIMASIVLSVALVAVVTAN